MLSYSDMPATEDAFCAALEWTRGLLIPGSNKA